MADGRANIALSIGLIFLLLIRNPDNCIRLRGQTDDLDNISLVEKKLLNVKWDNHEIMYLLRCRSTDAILVWCSIHVGGFHHRRVSRYPNSDSTFQLIRLAISGDIKLNPGPSTLGSSTKKLSCQTCSRTIACNHRVLTCNLCGFKYHIKCGNVTPKQYKEIISSDLKSWNCEGCSTQQLKCSSPDLDLSLLHQLPFASLTDDSFTAAICCKESRPPSLSSNGEEENESHLSDLVQQLEDSSVKALRVEHLNVCSIRNKVDELRCLQLLCRFELIAITETHLDKTVRDEALQIEGMKLLRLDRKGRKGSGCMLYYNEHLQATHRRDLFISGLEAIWLQVKFPNTSALFSVMYRPADDYDFFPPY